MTGPDRDADAETGASAPAVYEREQGPTSVSTAALQRYSAQQRRPRAIYAALVTAIVVVLGVVAIVAWTRGETNNTTSRTVAKAPADVALAAPTASPARRWSVDGRAALGQPQWRGTVVVSSTHEVRGIDARTGRTTWSYSRSDRTVCGAVQLNGIAVAVYRLRGNCDEVTALDAGTGERRWSRTLDMDGMPLSGTPKFVVSNQGGYGTLLMSTASVIYALDPSNGYNRWTYTRYGCRIDGVALGSQGALIAQNCSKKVRCTGQSYCKAGEQLILRNAYDGRDDKNVKNPDKIDWLVSTRATPVSADSLISAIDGSGALGHFNSANGKLVARTPLPAGAAGASLRATDAGGVEIVGIGDTTLSIRPGTAAALWGRTSTAPVTVVAASEQQTPTLGTARITVATQDGVQTVDGRTGRTSTTSTLTGQAAGSVYPLGSGFLVAGRDTTTVYG